jgi:cell division protein FtsB
MHNDPEPRRNGIASASLVLVLIVAMIYAAVSALHGEHGLFSLVRTEGQERLLQHELAALRAEHAAIANKTTRLSAKHLDLELLDERARNVLGLARPDEIIIR